MRCLLEEPEKKGDEEEKERIEQSWLQDSVLETIEFVKGIRY